MANLIEGKIAQVLSESMVVINIGTAAGVKLGMAFVALAQGEEVTDPETGQVLGRWEAPKGYLRVTHVQDRMATCEGFIPGREMEKGDPSTKVLSAALIAHSMHPETWGGGKAILNVNRADISGTPMIGPISVGDVVREVPLDQIATKADKE